MSILELGSKDFTQIQIANIRKVESGTTQKGNYLYMNVNDKDILNFFKLKYLYIKYEKQFILFKI